MVLSVGDHSLKGDDIDKKVVKLNQYINKYLREIEFSPFPGVS